MSILLWKLRSLIQSKDHVGNMMHTTLNTLKRNLHDILNAAKFDESNGCLEGTNRKIKQIERTAYGYANFNHLVRSEEHTSELQSQEIISYAVFCSHGAGHTVVWDEVPSHAQYPYLG